MVSKKLKYLLASILAISSVALADGFMDRLDIGNLHLSGDAITTTDANGDLSITPNGTGKLLYTPATASTVPYFDASKKLTSSAVTPTELGYVSGVTSSLCGINQSCTVTNKSISGSTNTLTNIPAANLTGTVPAASLPNPSATTLGGVESAASVSHQWINSISTIGVPSLSQPAFTDISGSVAASQLPNPSATTLGGIESASAVSHQWINSISILGVPGLSQPGFSDISGNLALSQLPTAVTWPSSGTVDTTTLIATISGKTFAQTLSPSVGATYDLGASTSFDFNNLWLHNFMNLFEIATPATPSAGYVRVYPKSDNSLYVLDSTGTETKVGSGGGAGSYTSVLSNSSLETGANCDTSWTSVGADSCDTSEFVEGKKSLNVAFTSLNGTMVSQSVTPAADIYGQNLEFSAWVKTSYNFVALCALEAGSEVGTCVSHPADGKWHKLEVDVAAPASGTVGLEIKTTSINTGSIKMDDAYVGPMRGIGTGSVNTDWVQYTPTISGFGTVSGVNVFSRRSGTDLEIRGNFVAGTPTASAASITPGFGGSNANVSINTSVVASQQPVGYWSTTNTSYVNGLMVLHGATTDVRFGASTLTNAGAANNTPLLGGENGSDLGGTSNNVQFYFKVPISGWTSQQVVRVDNSNTDWTPWTPTGNWTTNTTYAGKWRRIGDSIEINAQATLSGAPNATQFSILLPNGLQVDTTKLNTASDNIVPGTATAYIGSGSPWTGSIRYFSSGAGLEVVGPNSVDRWSNTIPGTFGSGAYVSLTATVPVVGWTNNQNAPLLVGSVTSNTSGTERVERVSVETVCSSSPCTIARQSGSWVSSITRSATGTYSINIASGMFSSPPVCTTSTEGNTTMAYQYSPPTTSAISIATSNTSTAALVDGTFFVICMGQR